MKKPVTRGAVVLAVIVSSTALALEDDFLDDGAPCFEGETPPELYGPLRASGAHRACLRTEAAVTGAVEQHLAYGGGAFVSWRSRKRAEAFVSFEQPGPVRFGVAWQAPLEPEHLAVGFDLQALLPAFGTSRRAGGSLGVDGLLAFRYAAVHARVAVTPGFYERSEDGAWLFGTAVDVTSGLSVAPWRFLSFTAELRATAGHGQQLRGALGARFTMQLVYFELTALTPALYGPRGFEGVLTLAVQPFERIVWPRTYPRQYDDEYEGSVATAR